MDEEQQGKLDEENYTSYNYYRYSWILFQFPRSNLHHWLDTGGSCPTESQYQFRRSKRALLQEAAARVGEELGETAAWAYLNIEGSHWRSSRHYLSIEAGPAADAISRGLSRNQSVKTLVMTSNSIPAGAIAAAVRVNSTLEFIEIADNHMGSDGFSAIATAISENPDSALRHLSHNAFLADVEANSFPAYPRPSITGGVKTLCALSPPLVSLDISGHVDPESTAAIAQMLKKGAPLLRILILRGCYGSCDYPGDLAEEYSVSRVMGRDGAIALAASLERNSTLTILDVSGNNIGDAGAAALVAALSGYDGYSNNNASQSSIEINRLDIPESQSSIEILNMDSNAITDRGAAAIAGALPHLPSLSGMSLCGHARLGPRGIVALASALSRCTDPLSGPAALSLSGCGMCDAAQVDAFTELFRGNRGLCHVHVRCSESFVLALESRVLEHPEMAEVWVRESMPRDAAVGFLAAVGRAQPLVRLPQHLARRIARRKRLVAAKRVFHASRYHGGSIDLMTWDEKLEKNQ